MKMVSKYRNKKTEANGIMFDSKKEASYYLYLKKLLDAGIIKDLHLQVPFVLIEKSQHGRAIKYIADFMYEQDGQVMVVDVKGIKTDVYRLKKRLMAEKYGIKIREV